MDCDAKLRDFLLSSTFQDYFFSRTAFVMSEIALFALHQLAKDYKISLHGFVRTHAQLLTNDFLACADILAQLTPLRKDKLTLKKYFDYATNVIEHNAIHHSFIIPFGDLLYPKLFCDLKDFPFYFFFRGNANILLDTLRICVVGTRNPNSEAYQCGFNVALDSADVKHCIISGLATGIDTAAHLGALRGQAPTLAILGTSLNYIYPHENRPLADSILAQNGALLSEYPIPLNHSTISEQSPLQFIKRNRLLAALASATIVVQSGIKGGTMHTVRFAQELNRWLFVWEMPHHLNKDSSFAGNYHLIQNGMAFPFKQPSELIKMLAEHHTKPFATPIRQTQLF
jgi:DNA protecting protein DprA